jgi:hypothetical protein
LVFPRDFGSFFRFILSRYVTYFSKRSEALSVCQTKPTLSDMRGSNRSSGNNIPSTIIAEIGQFSPNSFESPSSNRWDVFKENEGGLDFFGQAQHLKKNPASLIVQAFSSAARADSLAGESAVDDIDSPSEILSSKSPHVIPNWSNSQ